MLTVTRFNPAIASGFAIPLNRCPLVVIATSSGCPSPSGAGCPLADHAVRMRLNSLTISTRPERNSGSPPVSRTFSIPCATKRSIIRRYVVIGSSEN